MEQAFSSMALLLASCLRSSQASQNSMFSSLYSVRRNSRKTFRPAGFLISLSNDWDHNRISSTEGLVLSGDKRRLFLIHTEGVFRKFKQIPPWPHGKDSMRGNVCLCFPSVFRKRAVFKSVLLSQVSTVSFTKAAAGISLRTKSCCGSHKSEIRPNVLKCARCSEESMSEQAQLQSDHRSSAERAGPRGSAAGRMFPQWHTLAWNEKSIWEWEHSMAHSPSFTVYGFHLVILRYFLPPPPPFPPLLFIPDGETDMIKTAFRK